MKAKTTVTISQDLHQRIEAMRPVYRRHGIRFNLSGICEDAIRQFLDKEGSMAMVSLRSSGL